jgi:hypothetical protein
MTAPSPDNAAQLKRSFSRSDLEGVADGRHRLVKGSKVGAATPHCVLRLFCGEASFLKLATVVILACHFPESLSLVDFPRNVCLLLVQFERIYRSSKKSN